jgi:hypothetical protein
VCLRNAVCTTRLMPSKPRSLRPIGQSGAAITGSGLGLLLWLAVLSGLGLLWPSDAPGLPLRASSSSWLPALPALSLSGETDTGLRAGVNRLPAAINMAATRLASAPRATEKRKLVVSCIASSQIAETTSPALFLKNTLPFIGPSKYRPVPGVK